jgi:assimilatory nitrate reductase catalytic subunit
MNQTGLKTTCAYCGVGCGVTVPTENDRRVNVSGDAQHPANRGRLCVKGTHLGDVLPLKDRLLVPSVHGEPVSWDLASQTIADKIRQAQAQYGANSVAFYLSGQLLTEDYYAANKLAKGFLGTANVDTNSRLCMASAVAAHVRAFGEDAPPSCYEDVEIADLVVVTGSNLAWAHPVLFQRLQAARAEQRCVHAELAHPPRDRRSLRVEAAEEHEIRALALDRGQHAAEIGRLVVHVLASDDRAAVRRHARDELRGPPRASERPGSERAPQPPINHPSRWHPGRA